jgi:hypothetical protein
VRFEQACFVGEGMVLPADVLIVVVAEKDFHRPLPQWTRVERYRTGRRT